MLENSTGQKPDMLRSIDGLLHDSQNVEVSAASELRENVRKAAQVLVQGNAFPERVVWINDHREIQKLIFVCDERDNGYGVYVDTSGDMVLAKTTPDGSTDLSPYEVGTPSNEHFLEYGKRAIREMKHIVLQRPK